MTTEALAPPAPGANITTPKWTLGAAALLFVGLIGLDRLMAFAPLHIPPVTPWNPLLGVCVAIAITHRAHGTLLAFAAATTSGLIVPEGPMPSVLALLDGMVAAAQVVLTVTFARRLSRSSSHYLLQNRLVSVLLISPLVVVVAGLAYSGTLAILGIIGFGAAGLHLIRFWVGSIIGIVIFTPLFALHLAPGPKIALTAPRLLEATAQGIVVVATVWTAFGEFPQTASRYLFVVFLPMIWIVLRFGVRGAIAMNALAQVSMVGSLAIAGHLDANVTLFQALLLVLSTSGFIFGLAVDQSKAATLQLRAREEELSASLRVAATGELAGTLAHELGHPLGAISNYAAALNHVLRKVAPGNNEAAAISAKLTQEVVRATDTLHRMRDFFRTGALMVEQVDIGAVVKDAVLLLKDRLGHNAISPYIVVQGGPNIVLGDRIQLRAVVYNLLVNAIDALKPVPAEARSLSFTVRRADDYIILEVEDSGGGVAVDVRDDIFEPLVTTKKDGLGLGLSMSRSVINAHGGSIVLADSPLGGAKFVVTLPVEGMVERI